MSSRALALKGSKNVSQNTCFTCVHLIDMWDYRYSKVLTKGFDSFAIFQILMPYPGPDF